VNQGLNVYLLEDAVRGVNYPEGSVQKALDTMQHAGIHRVASSAL
jgi:nicotinamidase-related amidase